MDRDEYFRIMEDASCYNIENFFFDKEWASLGALSHIQTDDKEEDYKNSSEMNNEDLDSDKKMNKKEKNAIKMLDISLEDSQFYEKIRKEAEEGRIESSHKFSHAVHSSMDDYQFRKNAFLMKMINSQATNRLKYPNLTYSSNILLEKYSAGSLIEETFPGMRPSSNWPVSLDDLINKLEKVTIEEFFHQPFDLKGKFHIQAKKFIQKQFEMILSNSDNNSFYRECVSKGLQSYLSISLLEGSQNRMIECLNFLKKLKEEFKFTFEEIFSEAIGNSEKILKQLLNYLSHVEDYPVMTNYSINDFFNISKTILFALSKNTFSQSCSVTIDKEGKFIFLLLSGVNGGMFKVGTGFEGTDKGKVYAYKRLSDEDSYQWVYCRGKLYVKQGSKEFGYVTSLNSNTFEKENQIKLILPESSQHSVIKKKNDNYILLSDGDKLSVILIEPVLNPEMKEPLNEIREEEYDDEEEEDSIQLKKSKAIPNPKDLSDVYTHLNLMMYSYEVNLNEHSKLDSSKEDLIQELLVTFSCFYNREECYKALAINNWNFENAAMYLIDNGERVREPLLVHEQSLLLMQTKLEGVQAKHTRTEFKAMKNSLFDVSIYDTLKWVITGDHIMAYKLREGQSFIFSRDPNKVKEFKIKPEDSSNNVIEPQIEEYIVKGSFMKMTTSISLSKYEYCITYDNNHKNYYLISTNNLTSQSILISSTNEDYNTKLNSQILKILNYSSNDEFIQNFLNNYQSFDHFYKNFFDLFLLFQTKKNQIYWKFRNWNSFYTNYFSTNYNLHRDFNDNADTKTLQLLKVVSNRIEKTRRFNEIELKRQLGEEIVNNFDLDLDNKSLDRSLLKEKSRKSGIPVGFENLNWCSWSFNSQIVFENKTGVCEEEKSFGICLENKREFFQCVEGDVKSLENILQIIEDNLKLYENSQDNNFIVKSLYALYFWIEVCDSSLLISNITSMRKNDKFINIFQPKIMNFLNQSFIKYDSQLVKNLVLINIIAGWEVLCYDMKSQLEWFNKIISIKTNQNEIIDSSSSLEDNILSLISPDRNISPFNLLVNKLILQGRNYTPYIPNKINSVKYYHFHQKEGKIYGETITSQINPKSFQIPFYFIFYGENLKINNSFKFEIKDENTKEENKSLITAGKSLFVQTPEIIKKNNNNFIFQNFNKKMLNSFIFDSMNIESNDQFKSTSQEFWTQIKEILNESNSEKIEIILNLLNNSISYLLGDLNEYIEYNLSEEYKKGEKNLDFYNDKIFPIVIKHFELAVDQLKNSFNKRQNKKSIILYISTILNYIYNGITSYSIKLLEIYQNKLFELISDFAKIFNKESFNLFEVLKNFSSGGFQIENEKNSEYTFGINESANIYEKINFNGALASIVEIDTKSSTERPNYDLIVISEDHSYNNQRAYPNNNYSYYGTCFLMKLSNVYNNRLFLSGGEIVIKTNNDYDYGRGRNISSVSKSVVKSILKLKSYPYRNEVYIYPLKCENSVRTYLKQNKMTIEELALWIDLMNDVDYYNILIIKKLMESTEIIKEEKYLNENIQIVRLGLSQYEDKDISDFILESNKLKKIIPINSDTKKQEENTIKKENELVNYLTNNSNNFSIKIRSYVNELSEKIKECEENKIIDFSQNLIQKLKLKMRELIPEPNTYSRLKMLPSFNTQMKTLWNICELTFILTLLYHFDMTADFTRWINEDQSISNIDKYINPQSEFFAKKLNSLLNWMSSRVQYMKDTFDSIKNYSELIVENNNEFMENIRNIVIEKIRYTEEEKIKEKINLDEINSKKDSSVIKKEEIVKSKFHPEHNFATKTINFKKKANAKRLYMELPKKKSKKDSKSSKDSTPVSQTFSQSSEDKIEELQLDSISDLSLEDLFKLYPSLKNEFLNKENIKKLKEDIRQKIEADVKEAYFGNVEKLKNVCEINELNFSESNLNESLKSYTNFIICKLSKIFNFENYENCQLINIDEVYNKIYSDSPYKLIANYVLEKLFFLLELNTDLSILENIDSTQSSKVATPKGVQPRQLTKRISFELKDQNSNSRVNSQTHTPRNDPNFKYVYDSYKRVKKWENEDDNISTPQQVLIKSIFNWINKSPDTNLIRNMMNRQNIRLKIREIGIKNLQRLTSDSIYSNISKLSFNLIGVLSFSLKNSINNGLDAVLKSITLKYEDLENILIYYVNYYNNEIKTLLNIPKSEINNYTEIITTNTNNKIKNQYEIFVSHRIKNLNLLLSDINIIISYLITMTMPSNYNSQFPITSLQNMIQSSLKIVINEESKTNSRLLRMVIDFTENLRCVLGKFIQYSKNSQNQSLIDSIIEGLFSSLDNVINDCDNQVNLISNLLDIIYHIILSFSHVNNHSTFYKGIDRLFSLIMNSETPEIIAASCRIAKVFMKNLDLSNENDENRNLINPLYEKLGRIWTFQDRHLNENKMNKYNILIQMNSPEIDYLFLINALYYWEELHPTNLSNYKFKNVDKNLEEKFRENEFKILSYKTRELTYFNPLKAKPSKINSVELAITKRREILFKETSELQNLLKEIQERRKKEEDLMNNINNNIISETKVTEVICDVNVLNEIAPINNEDLVKENEKVEGEKIQKIERSEIKIITEDEINEKLAILKLKENYLNRISSHVKTSAIIGESASVRGFSILECNFNKEEAISFINLIYKAFYKLVDHIPNERIIESNPTTELLFTDDLIFPKFSDVTLLLPGCTHILKETTKPFLNVTLVEQSIFSRLNKTLKSVGETYTKITDESQRRNFSLNLNDSSIGDKILNQKFVSGISMSCIIDEITNLIYSTIDSGSNWELEFLNKIKESLNKINLKGWNELDKQNKMSILGLLIVCSGFFKILRPGVKSIFNNNPEEICKIVSGGHGTGKTSANVIFLKDKQAKIDKVNLNSLKKISMNNHILNLLNIKDLINLTIESYKIYKEKEDSIISSILYYSLKILTNFDLNEDFIFEINKEKVFTLIEILKEMTFDSNWIVEEEDNLELDYIETWERIYSKLDRTSEMIFSPRIEIHKLTREEKEKIKHENLITPVDDNSNDLVSKFTLPDSNYVTQLPNLVDMSKSTLALKNIQTFERYTVEEIFNYCKSNYRDYEYQMSLSQIRYHLSVGDITSAKGDISAIFDNSKVPPYMPLPREQRDMREVFKEECYPNNFYLAKLNSKVVKETGIKNLIKQNQMGLNELPVLLLLVDNSTNQSLVLYNDYDNSKVHTFWINTDHLMLLEYQLKIPSFSFTYEYLINEHLTVDKKIRKFYAKSILTNLERSCIINNKLDNFKELQNYLNLVTWQNYKLNPISGVFRNFKNYIQIKKESDDDLILKRMSSNRNKKLMIETSTDDRIDINQVLANINFQPINFDKNNTISNSVYKKRVEEIEKIMYNMRINEEEVVKLFENWCLMRWETLNNSFVKIKIGNLFEEYMREFKDSRSDKSFNLGNMGNKMLALHELFKIDLDNFSGMILSFDKSALLGPNAKLSFYSDPYGEHLIEEIIAIKNVKINLESVVFNQSRIWMHYTPGTRAFYINDWNLQSRDSDLPCMLTLIPYDWSALIWLTDYCTSHLFEAMNMESLITFQSFIKLLLNLSTTLSIPAEIQMNIFNITNRVLLKTIKYLSTLENMKMIMTNEMSIYEKFNIIGIDEISVIQLIKNIDNCHSNEIKEKSFSSSYVVNGVEIILGILAGIKESYITLDLYLKENFDYSLPLWIEAIIKLGQFLNFLQGTSSLENNLMREIKDELSVYNMKQFNNIFVLTNIPYQIEDSIIRNQIEQTLITHNAKIVDKDRDIQIIHNEELKIKSVVFVVDGYNVDTLKEMPEEKVEVVQEESSLWVCAFCEMENDIENEMCIFCEKEKTLKVKEPVQKKTGLIRMEAFNYTISDIVANLKNNLKNNEVMSQFVVKELVLEEKVENLGNVDKIVENVENYLNVQNEENVITSNTNTINTDKLESENILQQPSPTEPKYKDVIVKNTLEAMTGEEINSKNEELINKFLKIRFSHYLTDKEYFSHFLNTIKQNPKLKEEYNLINQFYTHCDNLQSTEEINNFINKVRLDQIEEPFKSTNFIQLFKKLESNEIDLWMENQRIPDKDWNEININNMVKISELIDIIICKETNLGFVYPASSIRFVPTKFNSINHTAINIIENNYPELLKYPLSLFRFYWAIIRYFNSCLLAALPFIKPPDMYTMTDIPEDKDYINIPFPKSISMFLSSAKGITFSYTKSNLIKEVIAATEYTDEVVQIPSFKFERLAIMNNLQKNQDKADFNKPSFIRHAEEFEENVDEKELKTEESMFLQAYEQAKDLDPAFFRSKKAPGDPHMGFKVEFRGEYVQGLGGPYRQFFSDISLELQPKDYKNKALRLLYPSSNNQAQKIDFKDKFVFTPSYNNNAALNQYEFLGVIMGICIRTGVHITLDLCSLIWKKITEESITVDDLREFDEGFLSKINFMQSDFDDETFESTFPEQTYSIELTDGSIAELIHDGNFEKVLYEDRFRFIELAMKVRLAESDKQIAAVKKGLCKMIPYSVIKLLTYKRLERLVCGHKTVDIEMLKAHTKYTLDLNENSTRVKWLWEVLNEISDDDKIKFIKFCWGQERLPANNEEYERNQVEFTIKPYIDKLKIDIFPKADTCFFSLELPEYSTKDKMKNMILTAVNFDNTSLDADKVSPESIGIRQETNIHYDDEYSDEE